MIKKIVPVIELKHAPPEFSYKSLLPEKFHASYKAYVRKLRDQGFDTAEVFTSDDELAQSENNNSSDNNKLQRTKFEVSKIALLKQFFEESGMTSKEYKRIFE